MKRIKIHYMGKRLKDVYPYATKWQVFKYRAVRILRFTFAGIAAVAILTATLVTSFNLGGKFNPDTVYAEKFVEITVDKIPPVMERIAKCESGGMHYKNGQVIFNANSNKTVDIGKFQINAIWNAKATSLGLDLTKEKDNEKFAMWLYHNRGTQDWYASAHCWNK